MTSQDRKVVSGLAAFSDKPPGHGINGPSQGRGAAEYPEYAAHVPRPSTGGRLRLDGGWVEVFLGVWFGLGHVEDEGTRELVPEELLGEFDQLKRFYEQREARG